MSRRSSRATKVNYAEMEFGSDSDVMMYGEPEIEDCVPELFTMEEPEPGIC
jgi:hypothetical protein